MEHNYQQLIVTTCTLLASIGIIYFKYWQEKRKKKLQARVRTFDTDQLIYMKLQEVLIKMKADRAYIFEYSRFNKYHSSITDINGLSSIRSGSITYEVVSLGTSQEQYNHQNIPIIVYSEAFLKLVEDKGIFIPDIDSMEDMNPVKLSNKQRGNKSMYGVAMFALDGTLLGILAVNYVRRKHIITADEQHYLTISAEQISGYM